MKDMDESAKLDSERFAKIRECWQDLLTGSAKLQPEIGAHRRIRQIDVGIALHSEFRGEQGGFFQPGGRVPIVRDQAREIVIVRTVPRIVLTMGDQGPKREVTLRTVLPSHWKTTSR